MIDRIPRKPMADRNVYLGQVNHKFRDELFLPYSVGAIQAYCCQFPDIVDAFEFRELLYRRDEPAAVARSLATPHVLGLSCYVWNWEYNQVLAREVRVLHPDCLVVLGGPHVPSRSDDFLVRHPWVDILVHGEGEQAFADILRETLKPSPNFRTVAGLTIRLDNGTSYTTEPRGSLKDLSVLPSPYTTGVFDSLWDEHARWNASQETHRGCPYSCSFCDWGSAVFTSVRPLDDHRILAELQWFGSHSIEVLYNCDANYGLLPRDIRLTERLVDVKRSSGYPRQFRPAFAKNSDERVFAIARLLNSAGLQKGVTLSMQSLDETCLENVSRENIRITNLSNILREYRAARIPTYTELILGLPGETYHSFVDGIHLLFVAGQHDGLFVNSCQLLPNSEMAQPEYISRYGIRTIRVPFSLAYAKPDDSITEYQDLVIETTSLSEADWRRAYLIGWAAQCFHCMNLTQEIAIFMWQQYGIRYDSFYEQLIAVGLEFGGLIAEQYEIANSGLDNAFQGESMDAVVHEYGSTCWYAEEASFLRLVSNKTQLFGELRRVLKKMNERWRISPSGLTEDLISYQEHRALDPSPPFEVTKEFDYDWPTYFESSSAGQSIAPQERRSLINFQKKVPSDLAEYAWTIVRYGRKSQALHSHADRVN